MDTAKGDQRSEVKDSGKSVKVDASMDCKLNEIYEALCCMLCSKLFEEATTVNLCLHTFCKRCIYQAVQETKCCPQCKEDLGSSPEEHLRDDEKIRSIAHKIQFLFNGEGQLGSEANDVRQGSGTNNQLEDHEISEEKFHHNPAHAEKENTLDRTSSQESSAFSTTASAVKMPQVACGVSQTNAEVGKSKTEEIRGQKKKKRNKNRRARQLTPGETSKTEEKKSDIGSDDIHKDEHAKDRESSTPKKQVLDEKQKEVCSFWFSLVPQGDKSGRRLPPINKSYIHLKDSRITVSAIQKYLAQKLNINDHTERIHKKVSLYLVGKQLSELKYDLRSENQTSEHSLQPAVSSVSSVDVVCCRQKLDESTTLKDIQFIWMSDLQNSRRRKDKWDTKELVIELGYIRSEKSETPQKK